MKFVRCLPPNDDLQGGVAGKGAQEAVAVETKTKVIQETIIIEEGERTLEDLIEDQRAKLHAKGAQVSGKRVLRTPRCSAGVSLVDVPNENT